MRKGVQVVSVGCLVVRSGDYDFDDLDDIYTVLFFVNLGIWVMSHVMFAFSMVSQKERVKKKGQSC